PIHSLRSLNVLPAEPADNPKRAMSRRMRRADVDYRRLGGEVILFVAGPVGLIFDGQSVVPRQRGAGAGLVGLSESVPFELFVTKYPSKVWMVSEANAEHVVRFSLPPVCRLPDRRHRIDFRSRFRQRSLQSEPVAMVD